MSSYRTLIKLGKSLNTRHLGGFKAKGDKITKDFVFLRGDMPYEMEDEDKQQAYDLGIRTVVDLRSVNENEMFPNSLANYEGIKYYSIPIPSDSHDMFVNKKYTHMGNVYEHYLNSNKEELTKIFNIFLSEGSGILFHCFIGKDRTGTVAAMLLLLAGVDEEDIINDYAISSTLLMPAFNLLYTEMMKILGNDEKLVEMVLGSQREHMEYFISVLNKNYGGVENYLKTVGFADSNIEMLRNKLFE